MMSEPSNTIRDFGRYCQIIFVRATKAQTGTDIWPKQGDTLELYGKTYEFKFVPRRLKSGKTGVKALARKVDAPTESGRHVVAEAATKTEPQASEELPF